jgi:hypothetical protein
MTNRKNKVVFSSKTFFKKLPMLFFNDVLSIYINEERCDCKSIPKSKASEYFNSLTSDSIIKFKFNGGIYDTSNKSKIDKDNVIFNIQKLYRVKSKKCSKEKSKAYKKSRKEKLSRNNFFA